MRKCLLVVALLIVSKTNLLFAQGLFNAPDTVCVFQPVQLTSNVPTAQTHFWGFCSGYAFNAPVGTDMGKYLGLDGPSTIEIEKDGDNYYGFVINTGISNSFVRLEFGNSLDNTPKVTNYGTMNNVLPLTPNAMHIVKDMDKGKWHIFIVGGSDASNSTLARIDFGTTLANTPNVVNFGNLNGVLNKPYGLFIQKEADKWYGFTFNKNQNSLIRMEFDTLLSLTPHLYDLGTINSLSSPNDFAPIQHNGLWYFFITNQISGELARVDMGASLATAAPSLAAWSANPGSNFKNPTGIAIIRDCDSFHMFITDRQTKDFIRVDIPDITGGPGTFVINNFGALGSLSDPTGMSRAIRDHDNIFMFSTNVIDSVLTKVKFQQCSNASIQSSTTMKPPTYKYNTAGIYNLYYLADEGLPTMKVQCKLIYVIPTPPIVMSADTFMCQGDSMKLKILSINAINKTWSPAYNISNTTLDNVIVWPRYTTTYRILLPYASGCVVDTDIRVHVSKVIADAGPDRTLQDGANTQLGGPFTSLGTNFSYTWTPKRYIIDDIALTPVVNPPNDYTYYLEVKDNNSGCKNVDTVVVRVECNSINMPNAFKPQGNDYQSRFGIANNQIVKLVYFRIYDRWGREVFSTTDPTKQWDGKINGEYAEVGVYVYVIDGFCNSGKRVTKDGNVTLIR
jgi:gliding motility-associated-like protein